MQEALKNLFEELADGLLTDPDISLLAVQVIALDPEGNSLRRHVRGRCPKTKQAYLDASRKFTGEQDNEGTPVRSIVFVEPNAFGYCKPIPPKEDLHSKVSEHFPETDPPPEEDSSFYLFDDDVQRTDKLVEVASMKSPPHLTDQDLTLDDLEEYFRHCLAWYLDPSGGTLIWLHGKASRKEATSLFAVFEGDLNEQENGYKVMRRISKFLQKGIVDYHAARLKKRALETTISNIFARNFAHNIGSHVAANATNEKVKERIRDLYRP